MGCCLSAGKPHPTTEHRRSSGGASPAALEEETVKEVLLETPAVAPNLDERIKAMPLELKAEEAVTPPPASRRNLDPPTKADEEIVPEVSVVSEIRSYSESYSNAAADGGDEDDGVVNQRPPLKKRRRPTAGRGRGERVVGRRAAPSPEKRRQVAPVAGQRRNVAEERRRDVGEGSEIRSKSPVRGEAVGSRRNVGGEKGAAGTVEPPNDVVRAEEEESLENPVVSLECFIFL